MQRALCSSTRIVDDEKIQCERHFAHSSALNHRAFLDNDDLIVWEGADSHTLPARMSDVEP